jgi:hypothetical protein
VAEHAIAVVDDPDVEVSGLVTTDRNDDERATRVIDGVVDHLRDDVPSDGFSRGRDRECATHVLPYLVLVGIAEGVRRRPQRFGVVGVEAGPSKLPASLSVTHGGEIEAPVPARTATRDRDLAELHELSNSTGTESEFATDVADRDQCPRWENWIANSSALLRALHTKILHSDCRISASVAGRIYNLLRECRFREL